MTDKQIIIDGEKITKEDFVDYFSIELTNRNVDERKEIGDKYFEIILRKEQECERLRFPMQDTNYAILAKEEFEEYKKLKAENEGLKILHESDKSLLKSKEQECERLKEERDTWHYQWEKRYEICESLSDDIDKLCEQLDQLKAENIKFTLDTKKLVAQYSAKLERLRQTLAEIKEIAEKSCCSQPTTTCEEYENCTECGRISDADSIQQILQKISECEVQDE